MIAPQELRERDDGPVVTDLDVVVLRDGRFVIGEVKSEPAAIDDRVCETLRTVATRIRPDVLLLAAPGELRSDALRRFPLLLVAPGVLATVWNGLYGGEHPMSTAAVFAAFVDACFVAPATGPALLERGRRG